MRAAFTAADSDGDGFLSQDEFEEGRLRNPPRMQRELQYKRDKLRQEWDARNRAEAEAYRKRQLEITENRRRVDSATDLPPSDRLRGVAKADKELAEANKDLEDELEDERPWTADVRRQRKPTKARPRGARPARDECQKIEEKRKCGWPRCIWNDRLAGKGKCGRDFRWKETVEETVEDPRTPRRSTKSRPKGRTAHVIKERPIRRARRKNIGPPGESRPGRSRNPATRDDDSAPSQSEWAADRASRQVGDSGEGDGGEGDGDGGGGWRSKLLTGLKRGPGGYY